MYMLIIARECQLFHRAFSRSIYGSVEEEDQRRRLCGGYLFVSLIFIIIDYFLKLFLLINFEFIFMYLFL